MTTYLLTYNPDRWEWDELDDNVVRLKKKGYFDGRWNFGTNFRRVAVGDRVFALRQTKEPKGIVAAGHVSSKPRKDIHYSDKKKTSWYVDVRFDALVSLEHILPVTALAKGKLQGVPLKTRGSGAAIESGVADALETAWKAHLGSKGVPARKSASATTPSDNA